MSVAKRSEILKMLRTERECVSRDCDRECGKRFRHSGSSWTYKRRTGSTSAVYFCSWGCMRKYDANDGRKVKKDG